MADNLPLLPEKDGALCADVRPVLREVFRDLDYLPPLINEPFGENDDEKFNFENISTTKTKKWVKNISSEYKNLYQQEIKLKNEHVKRLARDPLPNIYQLHSAPSCSDQTWKHEAGLIQRRDLKPSLEQNANCKESLWVKNILNRSSGNITREEKQDSSHTREHIRDFTLHMPLQPCNDGSLQSISIGEIVPKPTPPPEFVPLPTSLPDHIICIPSKLNFINFKIGDLHTQSFRLVNISKFEVRVSIRPPIRRELNVELCSRLVVTSGSVAEMKVNFRPKDVRAFTDQLDVRVSNGKALCIPIACYMEPPLLEILVTNKVPLRSSISTPMEIINDIIDLGTKLLGDIHRADFLLRCNAKHALFFILSEDSWIDSTIEFTESQSGKAKEYGITADTFFISPVRWSGGYDVNGVAVCRAKGIGLHIACLRVISSTAITRPLHLVADTVLFTPEHITIQAHDKDYDICSEEDPACEYYVNLGVAFPHRSLSAAINIVNHSALYYNYYWSARTWGVCSCWNNSDKLLDSKDSINDLCPGAIEAKLKSEKDEEIKQLSNKELKEVVIEEPFGCLMPCSNMHVVVSVPDAGSHLGIQRSVLMLILKDVPKESIAKEYEYLIVSTNAIEEDVPGMSPVSRQICEVLCTQIKVWWEVVPIRFTLDPSILRLPHSRRVKMVTTQIRATQLYGVSSVKANWEMFGSSPSPLTLTPTQPTLITLEIPLLSEKSPQTDVVRLTSENKEWSTSTLIEQYCDTRHLSIKPSFIWLGVVSPGANLRAKFTVVNDTHQDLDWSASCYRVCGARGVADACAHRPPCGTCHNCACNCSMLTPTRGTLKHSQRDQLFYKATAPDSEGCVATLIQVGSEGSSQAGSSSSARASLLAYRVLTPQLVLRVLPCYGDKQRECEECSLDVVDNTPHSAALRPSVALTLGHRTCYRLRITNITPLSTSVAWELAIEGEDVVEVTFLPNEIQIEGHSKVEIQVVLEAKKICDRRLFIRKANVAHSQTPLYLVIDTAVSGVEVTIEFPIGDNETLSFAVIKLTQKQESKRDDVTLKPKTAEEIFTNHDRKRKQQQENICYCEYEMVYKPPETKTETSKDLDERHRVEILEEPPALTRVCRCTNYQKPDLPELPEPYCLQFRQVSLRAVKSRTVILRNVSRIDTRWRTSIRRWPRVHTRTIEKEQWAGDVREPGVLLQCTPASGELRARNKGVIRISVYADCWGVYHDQILIQVEDLEPFILDVWIEAIGLPLEFALRPTDPDTQPTLWMSNTDPERAILVKNTSRADLTVCAYLLKENEYPQDMLPFRLYIRLFDFPRSICPCVDFNPDSDSDSASHVEEMETSVELFLATDYGVQDDSFYQVEPLECLIGAGGRANYKVRLLPRHELAPHTILVLRSTPVESVGNNWYRPTPQLQFAQLRQAQRVPSLQASCSDVTVTLCALDLPCDDVVRVRKRFRLQNVGDGELEIYAVTEAPWSVDVAHQICKARCIPEHVKTFDKLKLCLPPRSSTEMIVEVCVKTNEAWPATDETYLPRSTSSTALRFIDMNDAMLLSMPLLLEMDYPVVTMKPDAVDFGDVSDGHTRKSYVTVTHSSPTAIVDLVASWVGHEQFRIWPPNFTLRAGSSERLYIQYTARWLSEASASGTVHVRARGAAGRWCVASSRVAARPQRCATRADAHVDYTDDVHLLPRVFQYINK